MQTQTTTTLTAESEALRKALTLAVVTVEQRVERLRSEWRNLSDRQQAQQPGLEEQIAEERAALNLLESMRSDAYRA